MKIRLFVSATALFLGACMNSPVPTPAPFEPTATLQGAIIPTRSTPIPTETAVVTATQTATLSPTQTPTATHTPEPTTTNTSTVTATPTIATIAAPSSTATTATESPTRTPAPAGSQQIRYGETVTGEINDKTSVIPFQFVARAGDLVRIELNATAGNLDPLLWLLDENQQEIARNDDARNGIRDSRLMLALPRAGTYTIMATRFGEENGTSSGEYVLILTQEATADTPDGSATPAMRILSYGDQVRGAISNADFEIRYTFEGSREDAISIDMQAASGNLDSYLILLDPDGQLLESNDDRTAITRDSQIIFDSLPATGTYTIVVTRFGGETGSTTGDFMLQLNLK